MLAVRELASVPDGYNPKKVTTKLKQLDFEGGVAGRARLLYLVSDWTDFSNLVLFAHMTCVVN